MMAPLDAIATFDVAIIEVLLALCLTAAAWVCLFDRHLIRACCCFVAFAMSMSLAWWWLGAPWLAVAELLMGVVLTGLCFFYGLGIVAGDASVALTRDNLSEPWAHAVARLVLALGWFFMVGAAIRYVITEMAYSPTEHPLLLAGVVITACALAAFALHRHLLRRLLAFNILGSGVFMLLAGVAGTTATAQALIMVGLGIAWLGSLLGVVLIRQLLREGIEALDHAEHQEKTT